LLAKEIGAMASYRSVPPVGPIPGQHGLIRLTGACGVHNPERPALVADTAEDDRRPLCQDAGRPASQEPREQEQTRDLALRSPHTAFSFVVLAPQRAALSCCSREQDRAYTGDMWGHQSWQAPLRSRTLPVAAVPRIAEKTLQRQVKGIQVVEGKAPAQSHAG